METQKAIGTVSTLKYFAATATVFMWASAYPVTRFLLQYYSPGAIMLLRFILAAAIVTVIGLIKKIRLPKAKDLPYVAGFGVVGVFMFNYCLNTGTINVVAGVSSFICSTSPVFTLIFARLFLKEIVKPTGWFGVLLSFCGLITVMLSQTAGFSFNIGLLYLTGAAVCGSILNVCLRMLMKTYTTLEAATYGILISLVCTLWYMPNVIREFPGAPLPYNLAIVFLSIFPAILAYMTWGYALSKAEKTTNIAVFMYLSPFISSLIGFIWLGETFSLLSLLGGVVIIAGMVLTNVLGKS